MIQSLVFACWQGRVRFEEENGAQKAWDEAKEEGGGKVEINGGEVEGRVLEGKFCCLFLSSPSLPSS